jgi:ABC-type branched-subunit amino acid transport system permease subunit
LALGVVPQLVGIHVLAWTQGLVVAILMLSLSLLVRTANEISLCQMTFAAIGAVVFYRLSDAGMPWVVCVVVAGIAAIPAGLAVSVTAIRLSGVYLALATLSFGLVVQSVFYPTSLMFGESGLPVFVPRPSWALDDAQYYYLVLAALLVCYGIVRAIEGARLGRFLQAKSDANHALVGLGVRTPALSMAVFCVAAGLAGIAGALTGPIFQVVGVGNFQAFPNSLLLVTLFVLGARSPGIGSLGASLIAAIALIVIPDYIHSATVLNSLNLLFGLAALEAAVASTGQSPFSRMLTRVTKRKQRTMSRRNDTELGSVPGDPWSESNLSVTDRKRPTSSSKATSWPTR